MVEMGTSCRKCEDASGSPIAFASPLPLRDARCLMARWRGAARRRSCHGRQALPDRARLGTGQAGLLQHWSSHDVPVRCLTAATPMIAAD